MAINFPSTAGQLTDGSFTYTTGGRTWAWDGVAWESIGVSSTGTDDLAVVTNRGAATNVQLSLDAGFISGGTSTFTGQTSNLQWTKVDNTLKWGDGSVAIFGANDDLAISHTTADGNRIVALGALEIDSDTISLKNAASTETLIEAVGGASGYVKLYYNNVERVHVSGTTTTISNVLVASGLTYPSTDGLAGQALLTDGSGGLSFGSVSASETLDSVSDRGNTTDQILTTGGLLLSDTKSIVFGAGSDLTIVHTGSKSQIKHSNAGNPLSIESAHDVKILKNGTSDLLAKFVPDGDVKLYHSAIEKLATTATGITVSGVVTATGGTSTDWNTAHGWGDHSTQGYLTSTSAETDPVFVASAAYNITNTKIVNWDAAYAWGDHAAGGYVSLTAISVGTPNAASGNGNITYNSANGEFKFTPQDLSNYLTSYTETSTLANVISRGSTSNNSATIGGNGTTSGVTLSDGVVSVRTGTGNVASIDLYCEVNNAHKVSIKAPLHSNFSGNINFTLPATHGSVDQVLRTDGSGNTSWVNQTGGTDTNDYVDTASLSGTNLTLGRTGSLADLTVDLSSLGGGSSADPIGTITIWSGTASNIPTGYQLCDGSASATTELQAIRTNVPDLRDRFVVGSGSTYGENDTGGSADAVVVAHEHTTNIDGGHVIPGNGGSSYSYGGAGTYSSTVFNMNSEGVSGTDKNLPPYWALCYIIKNAATATSGGGEANVQADWNESSSSSDAYIQNKPTLFSGSYTDLTNKPTLFSGSYTDLTSKPTLFSGSYTDLTNKPTIPATLDNLTDVSLGSVSEGKILKYTSGSWSAEDESSGGSGEDNVQADWNESSSSSDAYIQNKPTLFSGNYNDLTNQPSIPGAQSQVDWSQSNSTAIDFIKNKPTNVSAFTNDAGYITSASVPSGVPSGTIVMYNGSSAPTGWVICNGSNNTPDLRGRFIVASGGNISGTGGSADAVLIQHTHEYNFSNAGAHSHTSGNMSTSNTGSHTHGQGNLSTNNTGSHSHTQSGSGSGSTGNQSHNHYHTTSANVTIGGGSHSHNITTAPGDDHNDSIRKTQSGRADSSYYATNTEASSHTHNFNFTQDTLGVSQNHTHDFNFNIGGNTGSDGSHSHNVSGNTGSNGDHSHNVSGNTNNTGSHGHSFNLGDVTGQHSSVTVATGNSPATDRNLPPYYTLTFIMKT